MRWIADLAYLIAGLIYLPKAFYDAIVYGKNRRGWRQRFGRAPRFDPQRPRIWIHAVSLGEINATPRLVEALQQCLTDAEIVFSTTTDTGFARALTLYGHERVFRFPLDFSFAVARTLERVRPSLIVLVELEVWFNLIHMAAARDIPVAVINGRLTERSARRLHRLGPIARSMFSRLRWVGAQDETIAARFRKLGVPPDRVTVTGSLKWDSATVADRVGGERELTDAIGVHPHRPLWVCGSTGPGEEAMILDAYHCLRQDADALAHRVQPGSTTEEAESAPTLAIVPRKPERFDEVARLIDRRGFHCVRRSERCDGTNGAALTRDDVILGDTMGELRKFYSLADVVFVGRTLVPLGGSDPMEVAALGKPIIVGPHTDNFALPVAALEQADAIRRVETADELAGAVAALLADPAGAARLAERARAVVTSHQGATAKTVETLVPLLKAATRARGAESLATTGAAPGQG